MMATEITVAALASQFCDFLTVAIHTILYERGIYPLETFISAQKYNWPVRQSRHPKVCEWINDAVSCVHDELLKGTVERVAVVMYHRSDPLERFMFNLSRFPVVDEEDLNVPIEREAARSDPEAPLEPPSVDLEEQFRAVMSKLNQCGSMLHPLPKGCSYTVAIELRDNSNPPIGHPQAWVPVQPSLQRTVSQPGSDDSRAKSGKDLGGVSVTPVRAVEFAELEFEMWIEETAAKEAATRSESSSQPKK